MKNTTENNSRASRTALRPYTALDTIDAALEKKLKDFDAILLLLKSSGYTVSRKEDCHFDMRIRKRAFAWIPSVKDVPNRNCVQF